ncbi:MAG: phosphotransferase enzyme family protein [Woeseia sp.]
MRCFDLPGDFVSEDRIDTGLINDTFVASFNQAGRIARFVVQRINKDVFPYPEALMENVTRVTQHLGGKTDGDHIILEIAKDGKSFCEDADGDYWRVYPFIEGTHTIDTVEFRMQAREAAAAFGRFQAVLLDLPGPRLHETIPEFHDTAARYRRFADVLDRDKHNRAMLCKPEINKALAYQDAVGILSALHERGEVPERVTHNDAKINNVLFDDETGRAVCIIDLDTVMPGLALYDFADLVRTVTTPVAEDEKNPASARMRINMYKELVEGYLSAACGFLNRAELENLSVAGKVITIEMGLRFLTDFLDGDKYFRIGRPNQNLDRCRIQFALATSIDEQFDDMQSIVHAAVTSLVGEV